jgi:hypothetical protein
MPNAGSQRPVLLYLPWKSYSTPAAYTAGADALAGSHASINTAY